MADRTDTGGAADAAPEHKRDDATPKTSEAWFRRDAARQRVAAARLRAAGFHEGAAAAELVARASDAAAEHVEQDEETTAEELGRLRRELTEHPANDPDTPEHAAILDRIETIRAEAALAREEERATGAERVAHAPGVAPRPAIAQLASLARTALDDPAAIGLESHDLSDRSTDAGSAAYHAARFAVDRLDEIIAATTPDDDPPPQAEPPPADYEGQSGSARRDPQLAAYIRPHGLAISSAMEALNDYAEHATEHDATAHAEEYQEAAENLDRALDLVDSAIRTLEGDDEPTPPNAVRAARGRAAVELHPDLDLGDEGGGIDFETAAADVIADVLHAHAATKGGATGYASYVLTKAMQTFRGDAAEDN